MEIKFVKASEIVLPDKRAYLSGQTGIRIDTDAINEAVNEKGYTTQEFINEQVEEAESRLGPKPNEWGIWNVDKDGDIFSQKDVAGHRLEKGMFEGDELLNKSDKMDLPHINFHGFFNIYLDWCSYNGFEPVLFRSRIKSSLTQLNEVPKEITDNGGVYLISDGRYTKVGYCSSSPFKRLSDIQIGNPEPLFVAAVIPGDKDNEEFCRNKLEKEGFLKKSGEWLKGDPEKMIRVLKDKGQRVFSNLKK